ncbi:hypothetical protein CAPTEDRAFT_209278 [Capitella teleta]|uniref:Uncharacterized protein n=1 Tax=Capitella teleta TaxID=283909 RepID=R7T4B1_CAPTE|nr:hypothetical protein CAPTEDRAFT_209278 [Capitella teleta]|eukprot:ELT87802.1 hypothetical protein CAPTEDRAFT_209278 [Capitella teleta]
MSQQKEIALLGGDAPPPSIGDQHNPGSGDSSILGMLVSLMARISESLDALQSSSRDINWREVNSRNAPKTTKRGHEEMDHDGESCNDEHAINRCVTSGSGEGEPSERAGSIRG